MIDSTRSNVTFHCNLARKFLPFFSENNSWKFLGNFPRSAQMTQSDDTHREHATQTPQRQQATTNNCCLFLFTFAKTFCKLLIWKRFARISLPVHLLLVYHLSDRLKLEKCKLTIARRRLCPVWTFSLTPKDGDLPLEADCPFSRAFLMLILTRRIAKCAPRTFYPPTPTLPTSSSVVSRRTSPTATMLLRRTPFSLLIRQRLSASSSLQVSVDHVHLCPLLY